LRRNTPSPAKKVDKIQCAINHRAEEIDIPLCRAGSPKRALYQHKFLFLQLFSDPATLSRSASMKRRICPMLKLSNLEHAPDSR
jgi:hypothetical protein